MPTEPATTVEEPKHAVHALTSSEINTYRRQLQHALETLPEHATVRATLRTKLDEVLAEMEERAKIAAHHA